MRLQETGWAMAQKGFNPPNLWSTKDAIVFMVKNLTLIANQKNRWRAI